MGGIALGKGVTSSGLLDKMDILIRGLIDGRSEFGVVVVLTSVVLVSTLPIITPSASTILFCHVGRLDVHQSYYSERAPGPHRQSRRKQPTRQPSQLAHSHHWARLFDRYGHACIWIPKSNSVRLYPLLSLDGWLLRMGTIGRRRRTRWVSCI